MKTELMFYVPEVFTYEDLEEKFLENHLAMSRAGRKVGEAAQVLRAFRATFCPNSLAAEEVRNLPGAQCEPDPK